MIYPINANGMKEVTMGGVPNQGDLDGFAIGTLEPPEIAATVIDPLVGGGCLTRRSVLKVDIGAGDAASKGGSGWGGNYPMLAARGLGGGHASSRINLTRASSRAKSRSPRRPFAQSAPRKPR